MQFKMFTHYLTSQKPFLGMTEQLLIETVPGQSRRLYIQREE